MPTLSIVVIDPPDYFSEQGPVSLALQTAGGYREGLRVGSNLRFEVGYRLREDRSGVLQPTGDLVQRQPDGRRFVYLAWLNAEGISFRRLKVHFDLADYTQTHCEVRIAGRDAKGTPACASARVSLV